MTHGRKSTKSGRWDIPDNWRWCSLSEVIVGDEPEQGDADAKKGLIDDVGTIPLIQSGDLKDRKEIQTNNRITQASKSKLSKPLISGRKLLIAAARETMGRVGILEAGQMVAVNNVVQIIMPKDGVMLLDFLFYYFVLSHTRSHIQDELAPGSPYIPPDITATAMVVVPPLWEQQRIVERIEALTHNIERCQTLLDKQREDMLSTLHYEINATFTPPRVKSWSATVQMDEILTITNNVNSRYKTDDQAYEQYGNYHYIQAETIEPLTERLQNLQSLKTLAPTLRTFSVLDNMQKTILLDPGSTNEGPASKIRAVRPQLDQIVYHPKLFHLAIQPRTGVHSDFIFWSLLARTPLSDGLRFGDINITSTRLNEAVFPFPDSYEQTAIINHLHTVQGYICKIREKQDNEQKRLEHLKQNILEKAFRGLL